MMSHFLLLPNEIIYKIFCNKSVSIEDLNSLQQTCERFYQIQDNNLWKLKYKQKWPWLWENLCPYHDIADWQKEIHHVVDTMDRTKEFVTTLSPKLYSYSNFTAPVIEQIDSIMKRNPCAYLYCFHQLNLICKKIRYPSMVSEEEDGPHVELTPAYDPSYEDLTVHYYTLKIQSYVHQLCCQKEWSAFLQMDKEKQTLEEGASLFSKWFQPTKNILYSDIEAQMTAISDECRTIILHNDPNHPLKDVPETAERLNFRLFTEEQSQAVLNVINTVLYKKHKFQGARNDYYRLENSFIDWVLEKKTGIPLTLCIIYMSVCHRLCIHLEPINFPTHFVLSWTTPTRAKPVYIDAYNQGKQLTESELRGMVPFHTQLDIHPCDLLTVFERMTGNAISMSRMMFSSRSNYLHIFCKALELMRILNPSDRNIERLLYRVYYTLDVHYDWIASGICQLLQQDDDSSDLFEIYQQAKKFADAQYSGPPPIMPKLRSSFIDVKFGVGMVMKHKKYNYACVITGWDEVCTMPEEWIKQMDVYSLKYKKNQPFYNVLAHDGSKRYAAQENLEPSPQPVVVSHSEIGKYFNEYNGQYYIPNEELKAEYPSDVQLLRENVCDNVSMETSLPSLG